MIRDSRRDFEFSRLNSLLSWTFSQDENIINGIINGSLTFKSYESCNTDLQFTLPNFSRREISLRNSYNFLPVTLSKSNGFSSLFGKILSVIRTSPHFWQVNWPLPLSNGLSIFHLFFRMFWFLIKTSFKRVNKSPWYIERWWRGILNKKTRRKKSLFLHSTFSLFLT